MNKLIESLSTNFDVETSQMKSDKQSFNIQQTINKLISSLNYSKFMWAIYSKLKQILWK